MSHLGERVSALVDGELNHHERDRALAHLTFCADCRAEVDTMRALKSRLRSLDGPSMPADLTVSLLRMAEPGGPLPPRERPFPVARTFGGAPIPSMHSIAPPDNRPRGRAVGAPRRSRRAGYVAVGFASAAVALGTLFVVGGAESGPRVPPADMFANQPRIAPSSGTATPAPSPTPLTPAP
ncbi:zf-HC2 domain-containing protein [Planomonospora sp. ID67723]|uniref:anti-sigma factor family protein n=1 Tax=Planomonospora sp. ID67723 TaxID=2738134 RepID=UPI0018C3B42C|nr:zf-HC2 domain-containing protein [Planomonospora sp. ID67723]MBG0833444.1 zf-HC2 domain-containing protein [Planomonospora sp. ID67723]